MVKIKFVDGDCEVVETREGIYPPWKYEKESECFLVPSIDGDCVYPRDFIKSLKHIRVE